MSKRAKRLQRLRSNPKNVTFDDLRTVLEDYGFTLERSSGSHHSFKAKIAGEFRLLVVPYSRPVRPIYVKDAIELIDEIIEAGREVGEKYWQLPLDKEYSKQIKSDIADIKNVGGRKAGTITAAAFLKEFTDGISWAHLDIAGTAWGDEAKPYRSKGPTGIAVRTLLRIVDRASQKK